MTFIFRKAVCMGLMLFCLKVSGQYCTPTSRNPQVQPVITSVMLEGIANTNTQTPATDYSYSDFTTMTAQLTAGATYTLTVTGEAVFPHNLSAWIDYNHDFEFSAEELLSTRVLGGSQPLSVPISFTVPTVSLDGSTRLRVRAVEEPYGPWNLSNHPCLPFNFTGETEDYTVEITGGLDNNLEIRTISSPISGIALAIEHPAVTIRNNGGTSADGIVVKYSVNNGSVVAENIAGSLPSGDMLTHTFSTPYDFGQPGCHQLKMWVEWANDQLAADNSSEATICKLTLRTGTKAWYLHSNKNGGAEPLGIPPFSSTTNVVTMNTVFSAGGWQQEYFETADATTIFSDSSCVVFLDGSYDHTEPLESFLNAHLPKIENWVASGGKLFINSSKDGGEFFYTDLGFDSTRLVVYETGHMETGDATHPIFSGPHTPVGNEWSGFYVANAVVSGKGLATIVQENGDESFPGAPVLHLPTLAEKHWGAGLVVFGSIGASQFLTPMEESMNLRANILSYLHDCSFVSEASAIPESASTISVFPNPTSGSFTLSLQSSTSGAPQITVYDSLGRQVKAAQTSISFQENITLDLSGLPKGLYYVQVNDGKASVSKSIVLTD